jgi:hypothetical protein
MELLERLEDVKRFSDFDLSSRLSRADKRAIVGQAIVLLSELYVHLDHKRALHGVDPVRRLRRLAERLDDLEDALGGPPDLTFHREMAAIFGSLRDLHTQYLLPPPYRGHVAYLPFVVEQCVEDGETRYVVTDTFGTMPEASFADGAHILHWNGTPIERVIELLAERIPAATPASRHALAVRRLTFRSLEHGEWPDEHWIDVGFSDGSGSEQFAHFEDWMVGRLTRPEPSGDDTAGQSTSRTGVNPAEAAHLKLRQAQTGGARPRWGGIFRAKPSGPGDAFGHLRIWSFDVDDADEFVARVAERLAALPPDGLVIDVRGNPGGNITAAERLLTLFAKERPVDVQAFQLRSTPLTRRLAATSEFNQWAASLRRTATGEEPYAFPVTLDGRTSLDPSPDRYPGPTVLIVDSLTYSAADMFAAGYYDNQLGTVVGTGSATGAGGANMWTHEDLRALLGDVEGLAPIECEASFTVAVRRCFRAGDNHRGEPLEDYGVMAPRESRYSLTTRDVTGSDYGLLLHAARYLAGQSA